MVCYGKSDINTIRKNSWHTLHFVLWGKWTLWRCSNYNNKLTSQTAFLWDSVACITRQTTPCALSKKTFWQTTACGQLEELWPWCLLSTTTAIWLSRESRLQATEPTLSFFCLQVGHVGGSSDKLEKHFSTSLKLYNTLIIASLKKQSSLTKCVIKHYENTGKKCL